MGKIKKILCMLLVITVVIAPCSLLDNVFAQTGNSVPLTVEVSTDKSSYTAYGIAEITVNITNISDETVNNISAEAVFDDLAPVGKNSETFKEIESLKSGESFSFSYKATVNASNVKLNFFEKIILWFVRLFNGGYSATGNNFDDNREYISKTDVIDFGNISANNEIKVWYEKNNLTQPNYNDIAFVDISLDYIESDEFKSLNIEEKREKVNNTLNDLAEQGYINKESIFYNESGKYFYFENSSTNWENCIFLEFDEDHNEGSADDVELKNFFSDIRSTLKSNSSKDIINNGSLSLNLIQTQSNGIQKNSGNAVIMYGWDSSGDVANDSELNRQYLDFYESQAEEWSEKGLLTTVYTNTTVELYKFALKNNKLIVIAEHGVDYNNKNDHYNVSFVLKEKVSDSKNEKYSTDLDKKYIWKVNGRYAIKPSFFSHYYKNQLSDSIIYLGSCRGLGFGGIENHWFSYAFDTDGHAKGTLGFHNDVEIDYQCNIMSYFVGNLLYGRNMKFSLDSANNEWGKTGPNGEYAIITSEYSTLYEQYNVTGFVKDSITGNKISGVSVEIIDNNFYNLDPIMTKTTDENGTFYLWLPNGNYELIFTHGDYGSYSCQVTVENSDISFSEPILLTQKAYLSGTVKDNATKSPVKDASVLLQLTDNNGACIAEYTCSTDENGQFTIKVPVGTYTYQINKLNFFEELYETSTGTITLFNTSENILDPIFLTPKSGSDSIVDFGTCGADGDNATWVLYDDGELLITGSGDMQNYDKASDYQWYSYKDKISNVTIGKNITSIGRYAFDYYKSLTSVTIGNGVKSIGECAFDMCEGLTSVTIGNSVMSIGKYAFRLCDGLTSVTIPDSVTNIGHDAFASCESLTSVTIGNGVTSIDDDAFLGCRSLTSVTIGNSVTRIGNSAFRSCESLTSVAIPGSVERIGERAFEWCRSLTSVTMGNGVTRIGYCAFEYCKSLTSVTIPNSVTSIGERAFYYCTSLTSVTLPNSVTSIGDSAFSYCENLTSVTIPDSVTSIGGSAFGSCKNLTSVTIPDSVTSIGNGAFNSCKNLTSVTIPDSVTLIGNGAFSSCESLTNVTIPDSVTNIGRDAFARCKSLTLITVDTNNMYYSSDSYGVLFNKDKTELIQYPIGNTRTSYIIPDSVTSIGRCAFEYCTSLTSVTLPNSVTSVGTFAFNNCESLTDVYYSGNEEAWNNIYISTYSDYLTNATIHYNS